MLCLTEHYGRTNFEKLRVYRLAETLADRIWNIVIKWDYFAKATLGQQIVDAAMELVQTSLKAPVEGAFTTTDGLSKLLGGHSTKRSIGCAGHTNETY